MSNVMTSVSGRFSLETMRSPCSYKSQIGLDAIYHPHFRQRSVTAHHASTSFTLHENRFNNPPDWSAFSNPSAVVVRPRVPLDIAFNDREPQIIIVHETRNSLDSTIEESLADETPYVDDQISNDLSAFHSSLASVKKLAKVPRRYHTGIRVGLILISKFKRKNHIVESGNNKEGRKGKLRCDKCRKAKSRVYHQFWMTVNVVYLFVGNRHLRFVLRTWFNDMHKAMGPRKRAETSIACSVPSSLRSN
jgi:hypothetical protein